MALLLPGRGPVSWEAFLGGRWRQGAAGSRNRRESQRRGVSASQGTGKSKEQGHIVSMLPSFAGCPCIFLKAQSSCSCRDQCWVQSPGIRVI